MSTLPEANRIRPHSHSQFNHFQKKLKSVESDNNHRTKAKLNLFLNHKL
jgi:hypothetical protein